MHLLYDEENMNNIELKSYSDLKKELAGTGYLSDDDHSKICKSSSWNKSKGL